MGRWNLREKKVTPQLYEYRTILGVYVDNITVLGKNKLDVQERCKALDLAFREADIPITWSQDEPVTRLDSVGCHLDLEAGVLKNKSSRAWKFVRATEALLRRKKLSGHILQIWTGHFTSLCSVTPWGLSCLQRVYRFIELAGVGRKVVWSSVRQELKLASALAWMTWRSLAAPFSEVVDVGDSATSGYAMMSCLPPIDLIKQSVRVHEKWRFLPMPEALRNPANAGDHIAFEEALGSLMASTDHSSTYSDSVRDPSFLPAGINTQYARMVIDAMKHGSWLSTSAIRSQVKAPRKEQIDIEVPELVQPLDPFFGEKQNFKLLWGSRWKRVDEHINVKEARVALSSLKRCCRIREIQGHRKLTLSDNLSAVCAFSKGRSSRGSLNRVCQVAAALQFGCGIIWTLRHLETKRNPSDEPSRWFERKNPPGVCPTPGVNFFGSGSNSGACASSKPVKRHFAGPEPRVFPKGEGKFFLEIFAGTGRLTQEIRSSGISAVFPPRFETSCNPNDGASMD